MPLALAKFAISFIYIGSGLAGNLNTTFKMRVSVSGFMLTQVEAQYEGARFVFFKYT